jgi:hypothetical protein
MVFRVPVTWISFSRRRVDICYGWWRGVLYKNEGSVRCLLKVRSFFTLLLFSLTKIYEGIMMHMQLCLQALTRSSVVDYHLLR